MAFTEDMSDFFDLDGFAVAATYTPAGGSALTVSGIPDDEYVDAQGVESSGPVFRCAADDVSGVAHGDALEISGTPYTVHGVQPDGTGEMLLILEEV